nr:translation initiation factor IF-2-like [Aegilops tauschii subsp. strangulata]
MLNAVTAKLMEMKKATIIASEKKNHEEEKDKQFEEIESLKAQLSAARKENEKLKGGMFAGGPGLLLRRTSTSVGPRPSSSACACPHGLDRRLPPGSSASCPAPGFRGLRAANPELGPSASARTSTNMCPGHRLPATATPTGSGSPLRVASACGRAPRFGRLWVSRRPLHLLRRLRWPPHPSTRPPAPQAGPTNRPLPSRSGPPALPALASAASAPRPTPRAPAACRLLPPSRLHRLPATATPADCGPAPAPAAPGPAGSGLPLRLVALASAYHACRPRSAPPA